MSAFPVQLKSAPKPADYVETNDQKDVKIVKSSDIQEAEPAANPFGVKLKKAIRPADYEGNVEGTVENGKKDLETEEPAVLPVQLKKVGLPEERVTDNATIDEKTLKLQEAAKQKEVEMEQKRKEREAQELKAKQAQQEAKQAQETQEKPDSPVEASVEQVFSVKLKKVGLPTEG